MCSWGFRTRRSNGTLRDDPILHRRRQDVEAANLTQWSGVPEPDRASLTPDQTPDQTNALHLSSDVINHANAMLGLMDEKIHVSGNQFGDSSATGFMHQIKRVIDRQVTPPELERLPEVLSGRVESSTRGRPSDQRQQRLDYVLPPRHRADYLLDTYWRLVDTLYPFLDRSEVESLYRSVWTGEAIGEDEPVFLCLLNTIFSIACSLDARIPPEEREGSAKIFYERARELLELLQDRSVLTVQCFLILGQYLQSANDPQQCWNVIGLAIRIAQSLGLDLPSTSIQAPNLQQTECLRRVWHGCVLIDRSLSMTSGRPSMITARGVTMVPLPLPHRNGSCCPCTIGTNGLGSGLSGPSKSTESHFFIESLKLYEIINEALVNLYNSPSEEEPNMDPYVVYFDSLGAKGLGLLFDRDKCLCLWNRSISTHLRLISNNSQNHGTYQRQANILRLRYYHIRILLYRPVLSRFCSRYENEEISLDEAMPSKIALQCALMCLNTALEVIELFDSIMEGRDQADLDNILPAWWYSILYVYSAATVLVAARLQPSITAQVPEQAIFKAWQVVMRIMGRFQQFSCHVKRYTTALKILFDQVPQQHRKHRHRIHWRGNGAKYQLPQQAQSSVRIPDPFRMETEPANLADATRAPAPQTQRPATTAVTNVTNVDRSALQAFDYQIPIDSGASQHLSHSYPTSMLMDPSFTEGIFDTLELQLAPDDMSWLNSFPYH